MNPIDLDDYTAAADDAKPVYNEWVPFDGVIITAAADVETDGTLTKIQSPGGVDADLLTDVWCLDTLGDGIYDDAFCYNDSATDSSPSKDGGTDSDWTITAPTDGNYCKETWTVGSAK